MYPYPPMCVVCGEPATSTCLPDLNWCRVHNRAREQDHGIARPGTPYLGPYLPADVLRAYPPWRVPVGPTYQTRRKQELAGTPLW